MSSKSTILTEHHNIQTPCKLFVVGEPQALLIQPSARHEEKNDGVRREVELIAQASDKGFAMVFFDCVEWARALMPWADDAVSRDAEVGRHDPDTLRFIEHTLLPWLRERFGALPCIIGGYRKAARDSSLFGLRATPTPLPPLPPHRLRFGLRVGANMPLRTLYSRHRQQFLLWQAAKAERKTQRSTLNTQHLNISPQQHLSTSLSATAKNIAATSA